MKDRAGAFIQMPERDMKRSFAAITAPWLVLLAGTDGARSEATYKTRHVAAQETWEIRDGRFHQNGKWVFIKTAKLLDPFNQPETADKVIANIDVMVDRLQYNNFSINIYPYTFDEDGDGEVDPPQREAYLNIGRIMDHCWQRGVFCSLSLETYNVGGGGVPASLFEKHPEIVAVNALGEPAYDVEYVGDIGTIKPLPSIFHPAYLKWSRDFMRHFLRGLGSQRTSRLLYIETTVEPQYLGQCNIGDRDQRRAALDFSRAAQEAFRQWNAALPADSRRDAFRWPVTQLERDLAIGNPIFNKFRGQALGQWVTGDIQAIHSVVPTVYIAVDYNGRFDDPNNIRVGDHEAFLRAIEGADIIQIAAHCPKPWGSSSWDEVTHVSQLTRRAWAISEHMTATGASAEDDDTLTQILDNTLQRGTRWGWELVKAANLRPQDGFALYNKDWTGPILDVIEGQNWDKWLKKIGAARFVPKPRVMTNALSEPARPRAG